MISDRALFRLAGWSVVMTIAFFGWQEWRTRRTFAARGGKGSPLINTTGIRG